MCAWNKTTMHCDERDSIHGTARGSGFDPEELNEGERGESEFEHPEIEPRGGVLKKPNTINNNSDKKVSNEDPIFNLRNAVYLSSAVLGCGLGFIFYLKCFNKKSELTEHLPLEDEVYTA